MIRTIALLVALSLPLGTMPSAAKRAPRYPIEGVWKTDCQPIGKGGRHGFITRLVVKGMVITASTQIYAHSTCDTPTVQTEYRGLIASFRFTSDGTTDFDHSVQSITMTANASDVVSIYNATPTSGCGLDDWQLGVARGVEGRFCAPWTFPVVGTTLYERAWVSGDDLRIGSFPAAWTNISADKRPTAPGPLVFHRQPGREK